MLSARAIRRVRAQRGSVLSALLIIVAFLAILGGSLISNISGQFLLTQNLGDRIKTEATIGSNAEYAIGQLQSRTVPVQCSTDTASQWSVNLNGLWSNATSNCQAIVPDQVTNLSPGTFPVDGTHVSIGGRDTYLVGNSTGKVYNYSFGTTSALWSLGLGSAVTGPPAQAADSSESGHFMTAVPDGNQVALVDDGGSSALRKCQLPASGTVASRPGFENPPAGTTSYFPGYVFFGDASGDLYVYDARADGGCGQIDSTSTLGGAVVGGPLVLTGERWFGQNNVCGNQGDVDPGQVGSSVDIFAVVNQGGTARLVHYQYCEVSGGGQGTITNLSSINSRSLGIANPVGVAYSSTTPAGGSSIRLAVTGQSGQVALASIGATTSSGGLTYSTSLNATTTLGGGFSHAPYWCHCPGGDQIGAGNQNGTFFVLNTGLQVVLRYAGGSPINTTPAADANGGWYFGADDGYIYDVEPPASGTIMFKAARFGPGGQVSSSPIEGSPGDGCNGRLCMYFGATSAGTYLAQIGIGRVMNLSACLVSGAGSTSCTGNLRLWTRLEVGTPTYIGGQGVNVVGWSYYSAP